MLMKIISGKRIDIKNVAQNIDKLARFLIGQDEFDHREGDRFVALNSALAEAMQNVFNPAYPELHHFRHPPVHKWWVAGFADRKSNQITVVIYDQGATIPVTYKRQPLNGQVLDFLKALTWQQAPHIYSSDAAYIQAAVRYGASQTDESHRGRGLSDMKRSISQFRSGSLRIWSRGGMVDFGDNQEIDTKVAKTSIGGTLIEWTVYL